MKQREHGIIWTDQTWNPVRGCTKFSEGCRNCYAARMASRFAGPGQPYEALALEGEWSGAVRVIEGKINEPLTWKKTRRVFVNSMSDLFHRDVPDRVIDRCFAVMAMCRQHQFQILTKRPERMAKYCKTLGKHRDVDRVWVAANAFGRAGGFMWHLGRAGWHLPNVWLGVSVEDQKAADNRIPLLLQTPAAVRFLSCEPLLGPLDLSEWLAANDLHQIDGGPGIDWVIAGGETGPGARPMNPDWVRSIRDQCQVAHVPFLFKQWGEWGFEPFDIQGRVYQSKTMGADQLFRCGKRVAGRMLDGREWLEMPEEKR